MTITFVGHGYVGLVTACAFANFGNDVWVIGHTPEKIAKLKQGDPLIYEPGLKEILIKNLQAQRLHFTLDFKQALEKAEIVFITVGTPPKNDGEADLSTVFQVAKQIGQNLKPGLTVVSCKSTVPVGTNLKVKAIIEKYQPKNAKVEVASCPEFLREGTGVSDTLNPDRIVIGSNSQPAINLLLELHQPLPGKRIITDLASAELIKYTSNAMLATKISFANLISFYCEKTGADVETVLDAVGLDHRIGRIFLYPGVGYGGSCLPKDVKALIQIGKKLTIDTLFLQAVESINLQAQNNQLRKILDHIPGKKIAIWGLSFKPNTDDIRFAPSVYLIDVLLKKGFTINVYDPEAQKNIQKKFGEKLNYFADPYQAIVEADGLCVLTEWNEFKQVDLKKVFQLLKHPYVFDGRNIYNPLKMHQLGFRYFGVGRKI